MKEVCEKHFKTGKTAYTVFAVFIILLSVAVPVIVIAVGARLKISTVVELAIVDIGAVVACYCYRKSAYYAEAEDGIIKFYTDDGIKEKNAADCKRKLKFASEYFLFFNDGIIRLCRFRKCKDAADSVAKEITPKA